MDLLKVPGDCKNIILMLIGILIVVIVYFVYTHKKVSSDGKQVKFEQKPPESNNSESNIVMYGKDSCPWCKRQKTELGDMWDKVTYVNCAKDGKACEENNITALPTWVIYGERSEGFMKKEAFSKKCGL